MTVGQKKNVKKTKNPKRTSLKSLVISFEILKTQKTSCGLGNFYISDCKFRCFVMYPLYLISSLVSGQ